MPTFQSTRWCFTINNPTDSDKNVIAGFHRSERCKYLVVGRETGLEGTPHLQGFVIVKSPISRSGIKTRLGGRGHFEAARGSSPQAATYCKKDGDYDEYGTCPTNAGASSILNSLYEWGDEFITTNGRAPTSPEIAKEHPTAYLRYPRATRLFQHRAPIPELRNGEPREWQAELEDILDGPADDRKITFYVDPEGNKGKSWFQAWYLTKHDDEVQVLSAAKRDDIAHSVDTTKRVFFFNIPRGGMEFLQYTILEQLKDRMVYSPKYNSMMKYMQFVPHVVVFCNEQPNMTAMSEDRYEIINM